MRAYDAVAAGRQVPFAAFCAQAMPLLGGVTGGTDEAVGPWSDGLRAARGEVAVLALPDFGWVDAWAEAQRSKKALGLFGNEERLDGVDRLLVPCWLAEVNYSQSQGTVFRSGGEAKTYAVVDACSPHPTKVAIFPAGDSVLAPALAAPRQLAGLDVALPRSGPSAAQAIFASALRSRPDLLNATAALRGLVYLPAAYARYASKAGPRLLVSCMGGRVAVDDAAQAQAQAVRDLARHLS
jgi:hypothetical protein